MSDPSDASAWCPACNEERRDRGKYLGRRCWFTLRPAARRALNKWDGRSVIRLLELKKQINEKVPLVNIVISK